jgi:hypothetical protein
MILKKNRKKKFNFAFFFFQLPSTYTHISLSMVGISFFSNSVHLVHAAMAANG